MCNYSVYFSDGSLLNEQAHLVRVLPRVALALSADAVPPVVAEGGGGVVGSAADLQVAVEAQVFRVTLASAPEEVGGALTDPAHVRAVTGALVGVLNEALCVTKEKTLNKT